MEIWRQDWETKIPELTGSSVIELRGVGPGGDGGLYFFYLHCDQGWYRFFLDEGVLFWSTAAPDPEDDLAEGETYTDVISLLNLPLELLLDCIEMRNGALVIPFRNGVALEFVYEREAESTRVRGRSIH